jgi:hypothetical protein
MNRLAALILVMTVAGCATGGTGNPFDGRGSSSGDASQTQVFRVRAMNPSFMDVTIYAVNAFSRGQRVRVGRLGTSQEQEFDFMMSSATRDVRFELEYFTGPTCVTGSIVLVPGDIVELILPAEPRNELGCR